MKKFFAILQGVVLTESAIALTSSCKKDIDNAKSLVNTTWIAQTDGYTYELTFTSTTEWKMTGNGKQYEGVYVITGLKDSLTGCEIILTPVGEWIDDDETNFGKFESETKLVIDNVIFNKK